MTPILGATDLRSAFSILQRQIGENNQAKGFRGTLNSPTEPEKKLAIQLALVVTEVAEAIEECRNGLYQPSQKLPGYLAVEEELADVIIRMLDLADYHNFQLAEAVIAKMTYNLSRPQRHGGKLF